MKRGLSLGALTLLSGCSVTDLTSGSRLDLAYKAIMQAALAALYGESA